MNRRAFVSSAFCSRFLSAVGWRSSQASALSAGASQSESSLTALRKSFQGAIYRKGDPRYEELRAVSYPRLDQHPALILQPIDKDDVSAGVRFAKANGLRRAVRRGGQSYAAYSTCEGGLLFEMSGLREVAIHPSGTSVRFGDGALCGQLRSRPLKWTAQPFLGSVRRSVRCSVGDNRPMHAPSGNEAPFRVPVGLSPTRK